MSRNKILSGFLIAVIITSCSDSERPNMLVTTKHDGHTIGQAMVYIKLGSNVDPNLPLESYDMSQRSDGTGQAYFKDLETAEYFVHAEGYDTQENNVKVKGGLQFQLKGTGRNKTTEITITAN